MKGVTHTDILTGKTYHYTQKDFILPFKYFYGGTTKHAKEIYNDSKRIGNTEYIHNIIQSCINDMVKSFYED